MPDFKKETIQNQNNNSENIGNPPEDINGNATMHTMQDDLNSLSGIFSKNEKIDLSKESKEKENRTLKTDAAKKNDTYFNPFLDNNAPAKKNEESVFPEKNKVLKDINASENTVSQSEKKQLNLKFFLIWAGIPIFAAVVFAFGGYYFWLSGKTDVAPVIPENKTEAPKEEEKPQEPAITQPELKYSVDKPNYLSVGTDNPDFENLKKKLLEVGSEIKNLGIAKPVEFVAVDERNNPIAFSIFAVISKIKLSSDLLKTLDDTFSLYIYSDAGNIRLSLAVNAKDSKQAALIMKSEESKFIDELSSLFIEGFAIPKGKMVFKDNSHSEVSIRYFNLVGDHTLSIDYAFLNDKLLIGTSKNTMWATIDKLKSSGNEKISK